MKWKDRVYGMSDVMWLMGLGNYKTKSKERMKETPDRV
jgi:hypothetical protein